MGRRKKIGTEIKQVTVATRITLPMLESLNEYLTVNAHVSTSDYLRDLIRKDLEQKGYKLYKEANGPSADAVALEVKKHGK